MATNKILMEVKILLVKPNNFPSAPLMLPKSNQNLLLSNGIMWF